MPKKRRNCFVVLGGVNLAIASTFLGWGWMPVRVSQNPRYSSSSTANSDLHTLALKPAFSILCPAQLVETSLDIKLKDSFSVNKL
jgi:hypothetical protein